MSARLCAFTGNRAEYGLFEPILSHLNSLEKFEVTLIVSGAHLQEEYGETKREIDTASFSNIAYCPIEFVKNTPSYTPLAMAVTIEKVSRILEELRPDFFLVYADRFESFAALVAATQMNIPTIHFEGGDKTEGGALDDSVRHAMTKLAHIHFVTNEDSAKRVLALGEETWRVHNIGFGVIDRIKQGKFAPREEVELELKIDASKPIAVFTLHPITTAPNESEAQINECIVALTALIRDGVQVVATYPNNDLGSQVIIDSLERLSIRFANNFLLRKSLGSYLYHGLLSMGDGNRSRVVCVGNSSSGIKETPAFGCPTVNIGARQEGRLRGQNVIDVDFNAEDIIRAVRRGLFDDAFRQLCRSSDNPYYKGGTGARAAQILEDTLEIEKGIILTKKLTI